MRLPPVPDDEAPFVRLLVDFSRELRSAGLAVGSGDVVTYSAAMAALDPTDLLDLYWAGRTTTSAYDDVTRKATITTPDGEVNEVGLQIGG